MLKSITHGGLKNDAYVLCVPRDVRYSMKSIDFIARPTAGVRTGNDSVYIFRTIKLDNT